MESKGTTKPHHTTELLWEVYWRVGCRVGLSARVEGGGKGLLFLRGSSEYMHMGSLLSTRWLRWSRGHILAAAVDLSARFPRAGRGKCLNANTSYIFSE